MQFRSVKWLIGAVVLALSGCGDSSSPVTTPPPPAPPVVYTDPAQYGTPFAGIPESKDIVMYEVNLRAFSPQGTFAGVAARLDDIKSLGVNTIWLMPIYPVGILNSVGQLGSPYSVRDYKAVSSEYGTLDDLRNLVDQAHSKGIAVILDWVANHTAWDNPWITNVTWYTRNGSGDIVIPPGTNWNDVADLNFSSSAMRRAMINAMKYWILAANVDGYRCDYADGVPFDFWQQAIDSLETIPGRELIMLAEGSRLDHFAAGFGLNYAWDYFGALNNVFDSNQPPSHLFTTNSNETFNMPPGTFKLRFTANHDEVAWNDTPLGLFGGLDGSMAAFVLASFVGGVPLLYNGQEVGCPVKLPFFSKSPIDWDLNPDVLQEYQSILSKRTLLDVGGAGLPESYADGDIVAFRRVLPDTREMLVLVNIRNAAKNFTVPGALMNTDWTEPLDNDAAVHLATSVALGPYEYRILVR